MEDNLKKKIWKTTSFLLKIKDELNFLTLEGDLNYLKIEDDLTNTTTKNIKAQFKKSTLIGFDIIVN